MMQSLILTFFLCAVNIPSEVVTLESALTQAKAENKLVLLYFSGSDWCVPCMKFKKELQSNSFFARQLDKTAIIYQVDFPRKNDSSQEIIDYKKSLADKYNSRGAYPKFLILDKNGEVLKEKTGFSSSEVPQFLDWVTN